MTSVSFCELMKQIYRMLQFLDFFISELVKAVEKTFELVLVRLENNIRANTSVLQAWRPTRF